MAHHSFSYNGYDIYLSSSKHAATNSLQICVPHGKARLVKKYFSFKKYDVYGHAKASKKVTEWIDKNPLPIMINKTTPLRKIIDWEKRTIRGGYLILLEIEDPEEADGRMTLQRKQIKEFIGPIATRSFIEGSLIAHHYDPFDYDVSEFLRRKGIHAETKK